MKIIAYGSAFALALAWAAAADAGTITGCNFPANGTGQTYVMTGGINCTGAQHGVVLSGTSNTVDCQRFTLAGPNRVGLPDDGFGIEVTGSGHLIRNCTITGFRRGIRLHGAIGVTVTNNLIHHNGDFTGHTGYGIDLDGSPAASGNAIWNNPNISDNADEGIHLGTGTSGNTVSHNTIFGNAPGVVGKGEAVYLRQSTGNLIAWNILGSASGNGGAAIYFRDASNNWAWFNFVSQVGRETVQLCGTSAGNSVLSNARTADSVFLTTQPGGGIVLSQCDGVTPSPGANTVAVVFTDVPLKYELGGGGTNGVRGVAAQDISALWWAAITAGCGGSIYCPGSPVTRGEMAVFLERSMGQFAPPACTSAPFADVPTTHLFCAWIQELALDGITAGCGGGNYCPGAQVTRDQMAVFLLRAKHGGGYVPPTPVAQTFADVPLTSPFAAWIYQLVAEGITAGCSGGNYCPGTAVMRDQMAIFLQRTFGLLVP